MGCGSQTVSTEVRSPQRHPRSKKATVINSYHHNYHQIHDFSTFQPSNVDEDVWGVGFQSYSGI